jgi:hypothetical protein
MNIREANTIVGNLNAADLNTLVTAIKNRHNVLNIMAKAQFVKGDKVAFVSNRTGLEVVGVVRSIGSKNIKVDVATPDGNQGWIVTAAMIYAKP